MAVFDQTGLPRRGTYETQLERQQFFDGQRLLASDLQGLEAFHRQMRELHNRSLHQPGIGNGFAVSGERGDRQVTIGAGYALMALYHFRDLYPNLDYLFEWERQLYGHRMR